MLCFLSFLAGQLPHPLPWLLLTALPATAGYSQLEQPPSLFVLRGSFQSYDANAATAQHGRLREQFAALGRIINAYPAIRVSVG